MRKFLPRIMMFIVFLLVFYGYLVLRLSPGIGRPMTTMLTVSFVLLLSYFFTFRIRLPKSFKAYKLVVYFLMGFLSFLATLVLIRDVICWPLSLAHVTWASQAFSPDVSWGLVGGALIGVLTGGYNVWRGPRILEVKIPLKNMTDERMASVRIAQISDLHIGPGIGRSFVEHTIQTTLKAKPSLIVLTGDIADGTLSEHRETAELLKKFTSACEVVFVPGNHEYYWNAPEWIAYFKSIGIRVLQNEGFTPQAGGGALWMGGVIDPTAAMFTPGAKQDVVAAMQGAQATQVKILLSHQPGIAHQAREAGFDLQLSGHTHAGQFFPFTLIVKKVHEFSNGLKANGPMWVYVNPGTGHWGPPIRLGTNPEITLLNFVSAT